MNRQHSAATVILEFLVSTTVIDANAWDALHGDDVIDVQLAEFLQSCTSESSQQRQPESPWMFVGFLMKRIELQQHLEITAAERQAGILGSASHDLHSGEWVLFDVAVGLAPVEERCQLSEPVVHRHCGDGLVILCRVDHLSQRHSFELWTLSEILRESSKPLLQCPCRFSGEMVGWHVPY